jgi:hypothetical protein
MDESLELPKSAPIEEPTISLYSETKALRESKTSYTRVCYVARLSNDDRGARLREDTEKWVRSQGEEVTGLMLVVSNLCVHLAEGSSEKCFSLLEWNKSLRSGSGPYVAFSVLSFTEENPSRLFGYWASKQLNVQGGEEGFGEVAVEEQSWDVYWKMCQIGSRMATVLTSKRAPSGTALESALKSTSMDLVPLPEVLSGVLGPNFISLNEFLDMYTKPPEITLDSEPVWPPPAEIEF